MSAKSKMTTGANDRPKDDAIGQTGAGVRFPETEEKLRDGNRNSDAEVSDGIGRSNPDQVPWGTPGAGENVCRRCSGTGKLAGRLCPDCGGTGKVMVPIGGA